MIAENIRNNTTKQQSADKKPTDHDNKRESTEKKQSQTNNKNSEHKIEQTLFDFFITKEGNRDRYTEKQYQDTKQVWKLYLNTGGGGINNFKHYLQQNIIQNNPTTTNNINCAQKISCLMSKI